jgi:hypothetical protein
VSTKAKKTSGKVDLTEWSLESLDEFTDAISSKLEEVAKKMAAEALRIALDATSDDPPLLYFKSLKGYPSGVEDPLVLELTLWSISDEALAGEEVNVEFDLREVLAIEVEECAKDGSWSEKLTSISAALKNLAADIDAAVAKGSKS